MNVGLVFARKEREIEKEEERVRKEERKRERERERENGTKKRVWNEQIVFWSFIFQQFISYSMGGWIISANAY